MTNKGLSKAALYTLDRLTDAFPVFIPPMFQNIFLLILGNQLVYSYYWMKYRRRLKRLMAFDRILVVADVGIGDAVIVQPTIAILRRQFATAQIDYICNQSAGDLLLRLPGADHVFGVFQGNGVPLKEDLMRIQGIVEGTRYSTIINMCPFIDKRTWPSNVPVLDLYIPFASFIIRLWRLKSGPMHISFALHTFLQEFFAPFAEREKNVQPAHESQSHLVPRFEGNSIFLTDEAIESAKRFLMQNDLLGGERLVFFNQDASCRYTRMPVALQIQILKNIVESEDIDAVLLGASYASKDVRQLIIEAIPAALWRKIVVVPHLPLSVSAALIDSCDMFISGDGGPVHIAAARRISPSKTYALRNQTAIVTVFGATDSRMYGYDSERSEHIAANQEAPSKAFVATAPCRNITCVNKWGKSCKDVRCFTGLNAKQISTYIISYFHSLGRLRQRESTPSLLAEHEITSEYHLG